MHLMHVVLACSIAAHFQTGRASDDGIEWPTPASESAALLQQQACAHPHLRYL